MTTIETRMTMIFNEWAARYAANPEEFGEILGDDGKLVDDYGESCMRYFVKIAAEMDEAGKLPTFEAVMGDDLLASIQSLTSDPVRSMTTCERCGAIYINGCGSTQCCGSVQVIFWKSNAQDPQTLEKTS